MGDIRFCAGVIVIDTDDFIAALDQSFAKMRANKTGAAGHQGPYFFLNLTAPAASKHLNHVHETVITCTRACHLR